MTRRMTFGMTVGDVDRGRDLRFVGRELAVEPGAERDLELVTGGDVRDLPEALERRYVRTAVTLPASSRRSASICSGLGSTCGTGSWPEPNGENAMPCTWSGHGGSGSGRFSQAHSANVNAAKMAATTMLDALIVLT